MYNSWENAKYVLHYIACDMLSAFTFDEYTYVLSAENLKQRSLNSFHHHYIQLNRMRQYISSQFISISVHRQLGLTSKSLLTKCANLFAYD